MNGHAQRLVRALVCGVVPAALLATMAAVPVAAWSRLPGRVADHWTLTGTANGAEPRLVPFLILGVLAVIGVAILWVGVATLRHDLRRPGPGARGWAGRRSRGSFGPAGVVLAGLFMTAIATASCVQVVVANAGVSDWREASAGLDGMPGVVGGPVLLTAAAGYLLRRVGGAGPVDDGSARPSLGLRENERAIWTGRAQSRWPWAAAIVLLAGGVLAGLAGGLWIVTPVLAAVAVLTCQHTSVRVTVAARGVTVAYGPLGLRLTRIPLRRIAHAEAVSQMEFTFGYRGSLAMFGSALVAVRRGPALALTLRDRKAFTVTVDDAATGAALLNDLIAADR